MQTYKIENNSPRGKAFKVFGGVEEVKVGETRTLDLEYELADEQIEAFARDDVKITKASAAKPGKSEEEKPKSANRKPKSASKSESSED